MARPKGSKNRNPRKPRVVRTLEQVQTEKVATADNIDALTSEIAQMAAELKAKKAALKLAKKELEALDKDEAAAQLAQAKEQRRADADKLAEALVKSGKSLDEVLAMLAL